MSDSREQMNELFKQAWAEYEGKGFNYGDDALEQVRFGFQIAMEWQAAQATPAEPVAWMLCRRNKGVIEVLELTCREQRVAEWYTDDFNYVQPLYTTQQPHHIVDADKMVSAPIKPTPEMYYLQASGSFVGNNVIWWRKNSAGYTSDLSDAHLFTLDEALKQHGRRNTDLPWPKSYIDGKTRPVVDFQYLDKAMIAARSDK